MSDAGNGNGNDELNDNIPVPPAEALRIIRALRRQYFPERVARRTIVTIHPPHPELATTPTNEHDAPEESPEPLRVAASDME